MQILQLGKCECCYYSFFCCCFAVPSVALVWGQYSIKQAFFWGGGGVRGTPALDTHGKGCNQSLNIKLLDSFEHCWLMAVVC